MPKEWQYTWGYWKRQDPGDSVGHRTGEQPLQGAGDGRGEEGLDDAFIERLAHHCLGPLEMAQVSATVYDEVLNHVKDAIRGAYARGRATRDDGLEGEPSE